MHSNPISDDHGVFKNCTLTDRKCPKCSSSMVSKTWESSCGGYEDEKYLCTNLECKYVYWIDGIDS